MLTEEVQLYGYNAMTTRIFPERPMVFYVSITSLDHIFLFLFYMISCKRQPKSWYFSIVDNIRIIKERQPKSSDVVNLPLYLTMLSNGFRAFAINIFFGLWPVCSCISALTCFISSDHGVKFLNFDVQTWTLNWELLLDYIF